MRTALVRTVLLLLAMLAAGVGGARAEPALQVADQKGLVRALLDASHQLDDAPYRIDWSEFDAASPLLQAISAHAVDTGIAGDGPFLFAFGAGQDVRATLAIAPRGGGHLVAVVVPAHSPIHDTAGLAGHTIATTRGSIGHDLVLSLEQAGRLPAGRVTLVFLLPAQAAAALRSGSIDAWATWEPYVAIEQKTGARVVADGQGLMPDYGFQVSNSAAVTAKHAILQDFYHRLSRAYDWSQTHPDAYARLWAQQMGLPFDIAQKVAVIASTRALAIDADVIASERATIATYRKGGALPGSAGADIAGAFERSFTP